MSPAIAPLFDSPCVTVQQVECPAFEVLYRIYLWDTCPCTRDCDLLPAALRALGPWAETALPLQDQRDEELGCTVLVLGAYVDAIGSPARTHSPLQDDTPEPPVEVQPQPAVRRWPARVFAVAALVLAFMVAGVTGRDSLDTPAPADAGQPNEVWQHLLSVGGLDCTPSNDGFTAICLAADGTTWHVTSYQGPPPSMYYRMTNGSSRVAVFIPGDIEQYERLVASMHGDDPNAYTVSTPYGPAVVDLFNVQLTPAERQAFGLAPINGAGAW